MGVLLVIAEMSHMARINERILDVASSWPLRGDSRSQFFAGSSANVCYSTTGSLFFSGSWGLSLLGTLLGPRPLNFQYCSHSRLLRVELFEDAPWWCGAKNLHWLRRLLEKASTEKSSTCIC